MDDWLPVDPEPAMRSVLFKFAADLAGGISSGGGARCVALRRRTMC